jgi:hypothetical protein
MSSTAPAETLYLTRFSFSSSLHLFAQPGKDYSRTPGLGPWDLGLAAANEVQRAKNTKT